jgi:hypothetical protein
MVLIGKGEARMWRKERRRKRKKKD